MPSCYHHIRYTIAPGRRVALSQRSIIGRVSIYYATVFCVLVTDFLIPSNSASISASVRGGYSQISAIRRHHGFFLVIVLKTFQVLLHPRGEDPRLYPKQKNTTGPQHCKKFPTPSYLPPPRLIFQDNRPQLFCAFPRLPTTTSQ